MMNARDALGLQEDLAILNAGNAHRRAPDYPVPDESGNAVAAAAFALKARADKLGLVQRELNNAMYERNEIAAMSRAARETVDILAAHLAEATGNSVEATKQLARQLLSRRFDAQLDDAISRKAVVRDLRQIPGEVSKLDWYVPAP